MRRGEWDVGDVQNIADVLVNPEVALEKRNHWEKTSHSLLVSTILHVLYLLPALPIFSPTRSGRSRKYFGQ